jgi:hypothetical protein
MKKILTFLFVLALVPLMQAQWMVESFDNAVGPLFSDPAVRDVNWFTNGDSSYMNLTNNHTVFMQGTGSMQCDYRIDGAESWGGYGVRTTYQPGATDSIPYMDLSAGTFLRLHYKVLEPVSMTQTGQSFIEFKLAEIDIDGNRDLWYTKLSLDLSDASGEWKYCDMPLVRNEGNYTLGFKLQFGDGDQEIQWDHIKGFEVAYVYTTAGGVTPFPKSTGSVLWDKLELIGNRYSALETFDDAATGVFEVDYMSWAGTGASSVTLTNNTTDFVEGTGSMQLDYMVNCSQSWGGYLNMKKTLTAPPDSFANRTALPIFIKNVTPLTGTDDRVTMRFFISESSSGVNEDWVCEVPIDLNVATDWTRYILPLEKGDYWFDGNGKQHFPQDGFAQPWWSLTGDQQFNYDQITSWKIELSGGGDDYGPNGEQFPGTLLFDILQQQGYKSVDTIASAPPANVVAVQGAYQNLVTWEDVPDENGEKYYVYASLNPISDINADDVDVIATGIVGGTQVISHVLIAPTTNQDVTYYYAVTCRDESNNYSEPGFSSPVTNTAKGMPVIQEVTIPNFTADGNLAEWQSLPKFRMYVSDGSGHIATNTTIDNDADLSADAYIAIDQTYLYIAFDVNDNTFVPVDPTKPSYELDAPDIYIGLYDYKHAKHTSYQRGNTPDYHLRFNEGLIRSDESNSVCDSMVVEGPNYWYGENFPNGYRVEARVPLTDLATKRNDGYTGTDVISFGYGYRIAFDLGINDNDGSGREGMLFYSSLDNDGGWNNPTVWTHTWITNWWLVDVENPNVTVNEFNLAQNFPNPFNPTTLIRYSIPESGIVTLKIYDILGREVAQLINEEKAAGSYDFTFDASKLSSGVYMYKIESGNYQETKKMVLIK